MDTHVFDEPNAIRINKARLKHLHSLKLNLSGKKVIDVGCGVGHLAKYFVQNNCDVFAIDGRENNILALRSRFPKLKSRVVDVEREDLTKYGTFDVVFCYGLLYHTKNPGSVIKNLSRICKDLFLIETCIIDSPDFEVQLEKDSPAVNQALRGVGCRPSPRFVISHLRANGFPNVYIPRKVPKHHDFEFKYTADKSVFKNGHLIRQIFIASRTQLTNTTLIPVSDGHEFYKKDFLLKIPYPALKLLAQFAYRPKNFLSVGNWQVGSTEKELSKYRNFLKQLWNALEIKSTKTTKLIINWYNNIKLTIYLDNETSRCVYVEGLYEPSNFSFLNRFLKKGMTFIDIGANIGLYSIFAASILGKNGQVFAFEPSRREYVRLLQNSNKFKTINSFKLAIGDNNGPAKLKIADNYHAGHNTLGQFIYQSIKPIREEQIKTITLDRFVSANGISKVDIIKIDVEGYENNVLTGAEKTIAKFRPIILVEISNWSTIGLLKKYSYYLYAFNNRLGKLTKFRNTKSSIKTMNIIASPKPLSTSFR